MKRLSVFLSFSETDEILVGELAERDNRIFFQYDRAFLDISLWISPYKLPLNSELYEHKDLAFGPIFGLFDDSLPDGWGLMLMDRFLRNRGYSIEKLSVLDRLSFFGENTMGALTYRPEMQIDYKDSQDFDLYNLYLQSRELLNGTSQEVLSQLMKAGGSPGGARPKVLVGVCKDKLISAEGNLPDGYEHWIVKFRGNDDFSDAGAVEYAYSLMVLDCGITMAETRLFCTEEGERFFGIKRFDREYNNRLHSHTLGNLVHSDFRIPSCDYEMFFKVVNDLTKKYSDLLRGFRQMVFNICANNRDDHVKNFSFLMDESGEWSLSPAYDLTFTTGPGGEHSMAVDGEGRSPSLRNIYQLGEKAGLKKNDVIQILDEVITSISKWPEYAEKAGVSEGTLKIILDKMKVNIDALT